jgi:hypothetical protein
MEIELHSPNTHSWRGAQLTGRLDDGGFESRQGLGIFHFTIAFSPTLGSTQSLIQWVPGALSLGVKRPGREGDHLTQSSAEVKEWVELYLHSPMAWCSVKSRGQLYLYLFGLYVLILFCHILLLKFIQCAWFAFSGYVFGCNVWYPFRVCIALSSAVIHSIA